MDSWHKLCFLLVVSLTQVLTQDVKPVFIEDVQSQELGMRIVSGWEARPGQHPWQLNLRMVNQAGDVSSCGGSVIHSEWGITAAHCTALRITLVIRAGVTSLTNPVYIFESNTWHNHPSYNDFLPQVVQPNDISVIKFHRRLTFGELLRPIRLQTAADAYRDYNEQTVMASGYGRTWTLGPSPEVLNWVYLRAVSNDNCRSVFGNIITDTTICARYYNVTSQSTCQGDSGGPLVINENDVPTLIGVTSFVAGGDFGCHSGFPAGFCRVGPFLSWLESITGIDFENVEHSGESSDETAESSQQSDETAESSQESDETAESSQGSDETAESSQRSDETAESSQQSDETAESSQGSDETAESSQGSDETAESSHESGDSGQTSHESGESGQVSHESDENGHNSGESGVSEPGKSDSNEIEYIDNCHGDCHGRNVKVDVRVRVRIEK